VVEHVVAGHRFKISIPKEGAVVSFALAGTRCPQLPRQGEAPASVTLAQDANAATAFVRRHVMQRDVEIEVDSVDKMGTFLGSLFVVGPDGVTKTELGEWLLKEGLGGVHPSFQLERHANGQRLLDAMEAARRAGVGIWRDWSPEAEAAKVVAAEAAENARADAHAASIGPTETAVLTLTEVVDGTRFFAQRASDSDKVVWMHAQLNDAQVRPCAFPKSAAHCLPIQDVNHFSLQSKGFR
jgi:staphylococcal nuclease domain-containing protein 1|tara:strand:- start:4150 stop:4869 length:720 start_codon:yes stop_codon:yes gene_type:complete